MVLALRLLGHNHGAHFMEKVPPLDPYLGLHPTGLASGKPRTCRSRQAAGLGWPADLARMHGVKSPQEDADDQPVLRLDAVEAQEVVATVAEEGHVDRTLPAASK